MQLSLVGLLICAVILGFSYRLGSPLIIGLLASAAFGSTALAILSSVGLVAADLCILLDPAGNGSRPQEAYLA